LNEHPYCEEGKVLRGHGEDIAVLEAKVNELERVKDHLFKQTKEIGDVTQENKFNTNYIKDKLDKGEITRPLERKIDLLCGEFTKVRSGVEKYVADVEKRADERIEEITETVGKHAERLETVEKSSWVTDILSIGIKKLAVAALVGALLLGLANTALWGVAKTYIFKEAPNQQRFLYLQMVEGKTPIVSTSPTPGSIAVPVQNGNGGKANEK
jgi:hypothetical protein